MFNSQQNQNNFCQCNMDLEFSHDQKLQNSQEQLKDFFNKSLMSFENQVRDLNASLNFKDDLYDSISKKIELSNLSDQFQDIVDQMQYFSKESQYQSKDNSLLWSQMKSLDNSLQETYDKLQKIQNENQQQDLNTISVLRDGLRNFISNSMAIKQTPPQQDNLPHHMEQASIEQCEQQEYQIKKQKEMLRIIKLQQEQIKKKQQLSKDLKNIELESNNSNSFH